MENQIQDQTTPTPLQSTPPSVSPVFPKKNNLVVILLSVFLLITLLISGYLFLQVQNLTKQLSQLQVQPTPTPLSTEIPFPTPDPTANWKTYTNTAYGYSVKYPNTLRTESSSFAETEQGKEATATERELYIYNPEKKGSAEKTYITFTIYRLQPLFSKGWVKKEVFLNGIQATKYTDNEGGSKFTVYYINLPDGKGILDAHVSNLAEKEVISNQILSTLKFSE